LQNAQTAAYQQETDNMTQLFSQDKALNDEIQGVYGPIFQAGPSQLGFSTGELQNLNTTAQEGVASSFESANQAMKENVESAGGGTVQLPSGVLTKAEEGITTAGAAQASGEENQIQQADYAAGNANFNAASNALMGVGNVYNNSIAQGGVANQGGSAASTTANQIAQENEAPFASVMGALGSVAGAATSGFIAKG
jgi:hypothetical protein